MVKNTKKIVELLCCYCTRDRLNSIAKNCGYKNPHKFPRTKVEQIAYINWVLLGIEEHYRIFDNVTNSILVNRCCKKYVIDYIMRECSFNWWDEVDVPVHRYTNHELRIFPVL